jgi:hypothetical protein
MLFRLGVRLSSGRVQIMAVWGSSLGSCGALLTLSARRCPGLTGQYERGRASFRPFMPGRVSARPAAATAQAFERLQMAAAKLRDGAEVRLVARGQYAESHVFHQPLLQLARREHAHAALRKSVTNNDSRPLRGACTTPKLCSLVIKPWEGGRTTLLFCESSEP